MDTPLLALKLLLRGNGKAIFIDYLPLGAWLKLAQRSDATVSAMLWPNAFCGRLTSHLASCLS